MSTLKYDLPGISSVGLDLIALLNSPETTVKQIAAQAKLDPVIYGNLVACANSPMYQGVHPSLDILTSLVRLGQREIKRIVYQVVLRGAFFHESTELNVLLRRIWLQSLTANVFMQRLVSMTPEAYTLDHEEIELLGCLGLIHNLGYVVLLANYRDRFLKFFEAHADLPLSDFFDREYAWFDDHDHFSAGRAVLSHWNFPRCAWEIVGQYHCPNSEFQGIYPQLHSLLRLSRHVIMMTEYNFHPRIPADYWLHGTDLPAVELDFETLIQDVRDTVLRVEGAFR
ncbi:MAG: HDOD domain-containing protein [Deltaproteobacteria bacterium]|nr:HDOD domain-containing protein [Deltaproteobacteria bacterium]